MDNQPAFPKFPGGEGMTLRQWFAGMAMQGILASGGNRGEQWVVNAAFAYADLMLQQSKTEGV